MVRKSANIKYYFENNEEVAYGLMNPFNIQEQDILLFDENLIVQVEKVSMDRISFQTTILFKHEENYSTYRIDKPVWVRLNEEEVEEYNYMLTLDDPFTLLQRR